mgnify:FL=1
MNLLARESPDDYYCVQQYTKTIAEKTEKYTTGAYYWDFMIGIQSDDISLNLPYLASLLVHENWHIREYQNNGICANNTNEELECIARQAIALQNMRGSQHEVNYLRNLDGTHYLLKKTW